MIFPRRGLLKLAMSAAAVAALPRAASAEVYPSRPVRFITPFGSAGAPDIITRMLAQRLTERLGQSFVVEIRPGGAGQIGTEAAVRAAPDGYTLLVLAPSHVINTTLYDKLSYNFLRDIAPVAPMIRSPNVLVVNPSLPVNSVPELIAYAKANPGKLNMGSVGIGGNPHVAGELFKIMSGIDMVHVPYRSAAAVLTDLMSRASAGLLRQLLVLEGIHQEWSIAGARHHDRNPNGPCARGAGSR